VRRSTRMMFLATMSAGVMALVAACGGGGGDSASEEVPEGALVVYSGRSEGLVGPLIAEFEKATGVDVAVRYGSTSEMAAQLLEEGDRSPADVFLSQDAGALQAVQDAGLLTVLPDASLAKVDDIYRSESGNWVGISGRARVLTYNTELVSQSDLPASVFDLTAPAWKDQVGWAPTNASFQSFVTAMRLAAGDEATEQWLKDMIANGAKSYESNTEIRDAVDAGTIKVGLSNHYYLYEKIKELGPDAVKAANHYFAAGDPGSLVNVAGVGALASSKKTADAQAFIDYLLSDAGQKYFADVTFEYPLVAGIPTGADFRPLSEIRGPKINLGQLSEIAATQELLTRVGLI
jgi:iron(III) transport system substrate-binding protein